MGHNVYFKYSILTIESYCVSVSYIMYDVIMFTFNVVFLLLSLMLIAHNLIV